MAEKVNSNFDAHTNALDDQPSKLARTVFIGGIPLKSTTQDIEDFLTHFDEVETIMLPKNKLGGQLKGYAKAVMKSQEGVERLMSVSKHSINGLSVGVSLWTTTDEYLVKKKDISSRKVYVKFKARIGVDNVAAYFSYYGVVEQFDVKRNPYTGRFRDFGYITFESETSAKAVLTPGVHTINGEIVRCEMSKPNSKHKQAHPDTGLLEDISPFSNQSKGPLRKQNNKNSEINTQDKFHAMPNLSQAGPTTKQKNSKIFSKEFYVNPANASLDGGFHTENNPDSNPFYSPENKKKQKNTKKAPEYSKIEDSDPAFLPRREPYESSEFIECSYFKPTSRHYLKNAHHKRDLNHFKADNLQFKVRVQPLNLPGPEFPQHQL